MKPPNPLCRQHKSKTTGYQEAAAHSIYVETGQAPKPFSWITPTCETENCLYQPHLKTHLPLRLSYPPFICIYCGRSAYTKDHLLPRNWSGETERNYIATVPACGTCNSLISDTFTFSITERRELCHQRIRKKFARILRIPNRTEEELSEYGHIIRSSIIDGLQKKAEVLRMLSWPQDPAYDLRALEHSGIDNPYEIGLLVHRDLIPKKTA